MKDGSVSRDLGEVRAADANFVQAVLAQLPWSHRMPLAGKPDLVAAAEHTGQLSFHMTAVEAQVNAPEDNPTIGHLRCRRRNRIVAEYALRDTDNPMGVAEYQLLESLPKELETNLPSIEQIERELGAVEE